jgi:hypothetical protein
MTTGGRTDDADLDKEAVSISLERRVGDRWTVGGALGTTISGTLQLHGDSFALSPGPIVTLDASYRAVDEKETVPFVLLTASLGAAVAWTTPTGGTVASTQSFTAFDGRLGVAAGKTIANVVSVYGVARAFGLPILWHDQGASTTGTDAYHYQLGLGLVVRSRAADLVVEGVPLGERALVIGAGMAF